MQKRKDVQDKSLILHAVGEVPRSFRENKNLISVILLPINYFFLLLIICYVFCKSYYDVQAAIEKESKKGEIQADKGPECITISTPVLTLTQPHIPKCLHREKY